MALTGANEKWRALRERVRDARTPGLEGLGGRHRMPVLAGPMSGATVGPSDRSVIGPAGGANAVAPAVLASPATDPVLDRLDRLISLQEETNRLLREAIIGSSLGAPLTAVHPLGEQRLESDRPLDAAYAAELFPADLLSDRPTPTPTASHAAAGRGLGRLLNGDLNGDFRGDSRGDHRADSRSVHSSGLHADVDVLGPGRLHHNGEEVPGQGR
jgi:hypothetical protein